MSAPRFEPECGARFRACLRRHSDVVGIGDVDVIGVGDAEAAAGASDVDRVSAGRNVVDTGATGGVVAATWATGATGRAALAGLPAQPPAAIMGAVIGGTRVDLRDALH